MVSLVLNKVSRILSNAGVIVCRLVLLLFHTAWLTVTKKLEASQERNVSPTTSFYQHAKSLVNVIVKCCSMLYTVVYTPPLFVHFDDNFSKWTCVSQ